MARGGWAHPQRRARRGCGNAVAVAVAMAVDAGGHPGAEASVAEAGQHAEGGPWQVLYNDHGWVEGVLKTNGMLMLIYLYI